MEKEIKYKDDTRIIYQCGCAESRLEAPEYWETKCEKHKFSTDMKIRQYFNEPQLKTLNELNKAVRGMHNADIIVRKDGKDLYFQADWLRDITPLLMKLIADEIFDEAFKANQ